MKLTLEQTSEACIEKSFKRFNGNEKDAKSNLSTSKAAFVW